MIEFEIGVNGARSLAAWTVASTSDTTSDSIMSNFCVAAEWATARINVERGFPLISFRCTTGSAKDDLYRAPTSAD